MFLSRSAVLAVMSVVAGACLLMFTAAAGVARVPSSGPAPPSFTWHLPDVERMGPSPFTDPARSPTTP